MRKSFKTVFVMPIVLALSFSLPASWALEPQDALSARPEKSVYITARINDLNGLLQNIFSPANIETLASLGNPEDAQGVRILASLVSQIPAKSVALASGITMDKTPFLQIAASMPASVRSKLDRIAEGKASGVELVTLLVGEAGLLFAGGVEPVLQKGPKGPYYSLGDAVFAAKENLLLAALSPVDLEASLNALEKAGNRLAFKRRFDSLNYYAIHMDAPTLVSFSQEITEIEIDKKTMLSLFKAPFNFEMAFDLKPGSFMVSTWANVIEAMTIADRLRDLKPASGANLFLAGGGKLFFALAGPMYVRMSDWKVYPEFVKMWDKIAKELNKTGITEKDVENLLTGNFSLALGSDSTIMGRKTPGGYLALSGQNGAAAKILGKVLEDERIAQAIPLEPLKITGWDSFFRVDPALFPASLLVGVSADKNTLFLGVVDPGVMDIKPELPPEGTKLMEAKLIAGGFIDAAAIWKYLGKEAADPTSPLGSQLHEVPVVKSLFDAEPSIPFIKIWNSEQETGFMEFTLVDVPAGKRLFPKLLKAGEALGLMDGNDDEEDYEDEE